MSVGAGTDTTEAHLEQRCRAAADAAAPLGATSHAVRARWLSVVADALDDAVDDLVAVADEETALGDARLRGEVARTTGQLRMFGDVIAEGSHLDAIVDHADPHATPPKPDVRRMVVPIGPVAVFAASNFPFAFSVAGGDTASALAAGCPVVVKTHPGHPRTSEAVATIVVDSLAAAGAPEGTFGHVSGFEAGSLLVTHPRIRAVGFTGSVAGGRALHDLAASRPDPIPFYGELGSINPVVVTPAAAAKEAASIAEGLVGSFTLGVGQFCTKPGVVLVPAGADFAEHVVAALGDAAGATMLDERIAAGFRAGLERLGSTAGVERLAGPAADLSSGRNGVASVFAVDAAVVADTPELVREECFGPAVVLVRYRDDEELGRVLDVAEGNLTATLWATEAEATDGHVAALLERLATLAGRVIWRGWPTGVAVNWAMHHGGPWPATTAPLHTSVGAMAIRRFLRPVAFQDLPDALLPPALQEPNPLHIWRRVDGQLVR
ncbi:MAG: aldehyde dehydrogenase (NADP(+)) [Actinomycetota bacterium]|nr:aldehyde dehydrogenase (NADP(+)) [Actinomycetota bacterium]